MAQFHDPPHHTHGPDDHEHGHRQLKADEAPLDAASQSLADALKATFRVLKWVMALLIVAFAFSGFSRVDENEQALVLRFGKPLTNIRQPGLSAAWPFPVDQTLHLPVKQRKTLALSTHWPASEFEGGGLDPVRDGALLTGDRGLVHVRWNMTYQVENVEDFVRTLADSDVGQEERMEQLLRSVLQSAAVNEAAAMTALDIYPRSPETLAARVQTQINESLTQLKSGLRVVSLDIPDSSVPAPAKDAFLDVTRQQSTRQRLIRQAEQRAVDILNGVAGEAYKPLLEKLDRLEKAKAAGDAPAVSQAQAAIDLLLEKEVSGEAGAAMTRANAYYAETVHAIQADVREYETLLEEYRRNPGLLITRLWTETKQRVLATPGIVKLFLPWGAKEIRIPIGPDPIQKKMDERERLLHQSEHADEGPTPRISRRSDRGE